MPVWLQGSFIAAGALIAIVVFVGAAVLSAMRLDEDDR